MKRAVALLGSAIFLVLAPGTLTVYLPWAVCHWHFASPLPGFLAFRIAGTALDRKFGNEYVDFCARVPRWIPRLNKVA
jgi:protein-S-isoprenylcysteine O-methyltransferase Ste14